MEFCKRFTLEASTLFIKEKKGLKLTRMDMIEQKERVARK